MLLWSHFFEGIIPSKKNDRRQIVLKKSGRRINIPSARYVSWHKEVLPALLEKRPDKPFNGVSISMVFIYPDKRRRDTINGEESILDTLVDAQILKDDCWTALPHRHADGQLAHEGQAIGCFVYISNA